MPDIGKIIAGIDCCMPDLNTFERNCENCPYVEEKKNDGDCEEMMLADMRKLLEEQEQKTGEWLDGVCCSECGWINEVEPGFVNSANGFHFCPNCGARMVKCE